MTLTEFHKKRNEQCLKENLEQRHLSREEAAEQAIRMIRQAEDHLYQEVLKSGPFPGMTIVQTMIEIKRQTHREWFRPDFSFRFYSEDEQGGVIIVTDKTPLLSIGDKETDDLVEWDTVWEPNCSDECIQAFVEYPDDEASEDSSDEGTINYRHLLKHLEKIAPHIDWRVEDKGYDYDDGGGYCWNAIAVPNEQLHEAEMIIERIEQSEDIMQFSGPEDFAGPIYDERGELRQEITEFVASIASLRRYVLSGYLQYLIETSRDGEKQIMHLISLLADLYAAGSRLSLLENDAEPGEYQCGEMPSDFQKSMTECYAPYQVNLKNNPFEDIIIACEYLDEVQELFDDGKPYGVSRAVANWQFGFQSGVGWASCVLDALKTLHELYSVVRYGKI